MKKIILILLLIMITNISADDEGFIKIKTIKEIINNMIDKYERIKTYRANFKITTTKDNAKTYQNGEIRYRLPDTFILSYEKPKDQLVYSDGKTLKIYIPNLNILGEQSLQEYRPGFLVSGKSSLSYLRNKFSFSFYKSNKPKIINEKPYYTLLLTQKEVTAGFKTMILYVSPIWGWIITRVTATTINGDQIDIKFGNININTKMTDHEFEFNVPINTQTIKNPLFYQFEGE